MAYRPRRRGLPLFGYRCKFWSFLLKLAKNQPSWTLPANPGPSTGPFHWSNRPLSIREMLRLQTFPASWKLPDVSRVTKVRLVGNATPPLLTEILGRSIGAQLFWPLLRLTTALSDIAQEKESREGLCTRGVPAEFLPLAGRTSTTSRNRVLDRGPSPKGRHRMAKKGDCTPEENIA